MRVFVCIPEVEATEAMTAVIEDLPEKFDVTFADGESDFLSLIAHHEYDMLIVGIDGSKSYPFTTLELLKNRSLSAPVIALYVNGNDRTLFNALSFGAITALPFSPESFQGQTLPLLLENTHLAIKGASRKMVFGPLSIDMDARLIKVDGTILKLTAKEYETLEYMLVNAGKVSSRDDIKYALYGYEEDHESNTIEVFVTRLRNKLDEALPGFKLAIQTVRGAGYVFKVPEDLQEAEARVKETSQPTSGYTYERQITRTPKVEVPAPNAAKSIPASVFTYGEFALDSGTKTAYFSEKDLRLAPKEYDLLAALIEGHPNIISGDILAETLFGSTDKITSVGVYISYLRKRLRDAGVEDNRVINYRGQGFWLKTGVEGEIAPEMEVKSKPLAPTFSQENITEDRIETFGEFTLNMTRRSASYKDTPLNLTSREFDIFEAIKEGYPEIVSAVSIAETVYSDKNRVGAVTPPLQSMRKKLREANNGEDLAINFWGHGYWLQAGVEGEVKPEPEARPTKTSKAVTATAQLENIGPWRIETGSGRIFYQEKGASEPEAIKLGQTKKALIGALLQAYPAAISEAALAEAVFGDTIQDGQADSLPLLMAQANTTFKKRMNETPLRRVGGNYRVDLAPSDMSEDHKQACDIKELGSWVINRTADMALYNGKILPLNEKEFQLIDMLAASFPKTIAKENLARTLFDGNASSLNTFLTLFRKKMEQKCGIDEPLFENVRGVGYKLALKASDLSDELRAQLSIPRQSFQMSAGQAPLRSGFTPKAQPETRQGITGQPVRKQKKILSVESAFKGQGTITYGDLIIDTDRGQATYEGTVLESVSGKTLDLLTLLTKRYGQLVTSAELADFFFGKDSPENQKRAAMGVSSLRHQLDKSVFGLGDFLVSNIGSLGITLTFNGEDLQKVRDDHRDALRADKIARKAANGNGNGNGNEAVQKPMITVNGEPLRSAQKRAANGNHSGSKDNNSGASTAMERFAQRYGSQNPI